jgi:hypothetical protein
MQNNSAPLKLNQARYLLDSRLAAAEVAIPDELVTEWHSDIIGDCLSLL